MLEQLCTEADALDMADLIAQHRARMEGELLAQRKAPKVPGPQRSVRARRVAAVVERPAVCFACGKPTAIVIRARLALDFCRVAFCSESLVRSLLIRPDSNGIIYS